MEPTILQWAVENGTAGVVIVALGWFIFNVGKEHTKERQVWRNDTEKLHEKIISVIESSQKTTSEMSNAVRELTTRIVELENTIKSYNEKHK